MNAVSLNSGIFNGARIVGPAIGGIVMAKVGISASSASKSRAGRNGCPHNGPISKPTAQEVTQMNRTKSRFIVFCLAAVLLQGCASPQEQVKTAGTERRFSVTVSVNKVRPNPGEVVTVDAAVEGDNALRGEEVSAILFEPTRGAKRLALSFDESIQLYRGEVMLTPDAPWGMYVVTVCAKRGNEQAVAKAWFIVGKIIGDDFYIPQKDVEATVSANVKRFLNVGGNLLLVVGGYRDYDATELTLNIADTTGLTVMLSVETYIQPYSKRTEFLKNLVTDLWERCKNHPCTVGIYVNHEGSGIYLTPFIKDFFNFVKTLDGNPLTICAPYIEDPNLIGYLTAIDSLDVIELQCQIMGSRRHDNRCVFPMTRCRDHGCLCAGTALMRNKIPLSQIEQYGTLGEVAVPPDKGNRATTATPEDIYCQVVGVATAPGIDGFLVCCYSSWICRRLKDYPDEMRKCEESFKRGIQDYRLISSMAAVTPDPVVFYYPYTDWNVHCWRTTYCPAFAAFRRLGLPFGIVSFVPKKGEDVLPYYPMTLNEEQLEYLLKNRFVVVMPDFPGMEETDSILLKRFVEDGGVAVLFGPHIPYGDCFERDEMCGGKENLESKRSRMEIKTKLGNRVNENTVFSFEQKEFPSWTPTTGKAVAVFEDGSAAILLNDFGKGKVITISVNAEDAIAIMPALLRDIFDYALAQRGVKRAFDVFGANDEIDIAASVVDGEYRLAVVNHGKEEVEVKVSPLGLSPEKRYVLTDLKRDERLREGLGKEFSEFMLRVSSHSCAVTSLSEKQK
jgi:hypothetical protein